jgi:hypothetical protein
MADHHHGLPHKNGESGRKRSPTKQSKGQPIIGKAKFGNNFCVKILR